ncbi:cupin domain-containing protein [Inquilinus sp. Marseille-Q2685]|uniref:cupin domain-containing protein n=1 Tax=Inquilinus sp. Marseille-Q2685 TaxID=2866581 RepID=UPI0021070BC2|nr:cupin domain-containing protein [Inquilinus sp. Marseille-Q2685]
MGIGQGRCIHGAHPRDVGRRRQAIVAQGRAAAAHAGTRSAAQAGSHLGPTRKEMWHHHPETDEAFLVLEGRLRIDFRDGAVTLGPGEMFVVPKGVDHKPCAEGEVKLVLIEPRGILNTGHEGGDRTAQNDVWI